MKGLTTIGDPVLKQIAREVPQQEIQQREALVNEMFAVLKKSGGVGIAAPQVGVSERIIILEVEDYLRGGEKSLVVMFNPEIKVLDREMCSEIEGCLSVPGIRGLVPRYKKVMVKYSDRAGQPKQEILQDFSARIVQHEVDHLEGIVFLERVVERKSFITEENYRKQMERLEQEQIRD